MSARFSDAELKSRLKGHNYEVPPITDTTRHILTKKLLQLDEQAAKQKKFPGKSAKRSSAALPPPSAENGKPKQSTKARNTRQSTPVLYDYSSAEDENSAAKNGGNESLIKQVVRRVSASSRNQNRNSSRGSTPTAARTTTTTNRVGERRSSRSSRSSVPTTTTNGHSKRSLMTHSEEEDEEESEEESEEEDEDEEEEIRNMGVQTSLVDSPDSPENNSKLRYRNSVTRRSFAASTPINTQINKFPDIIPSPLNSVALRKQIAKNKEFGSLGEALNTLPMRSSTSSSSNNTTPNNSNNSTHQHQQIVTSAKANAAAAAAAEYNKLKNNNSYNFISKLIIGAALLFFIVLAFKYSNLRPSAEIAHKISICDPENKNIDPKSCVQPHDIQPILKLYKRILKILDNDPDEENCHKKKILTLEEIKFKLSDEDEHNLLGKLYDLLVENPHWGINVTEDGKLSVNNPTLNWHCWSLFKLAQILEYSFIFGAYCLYAIIISGSLILCNKLRIWRRDKNLRERQDVFELVEQVLSVLATTQNRNFIPIRHIRDQLIIPQDRKRKQYLWDKVVQYIRQHESRVREDVQTILGEEYQVWQWIPENMGRWATNTPNPYVPIRTPMTPASPQWQGSAFNSLNKNVAAPSTAPTTCLKVRHMFNAQTLQENPSNWVWQVKEEVLRRCIGFPILHIAVDVNSMEGCVYIKAMHTEAAGNIFKSLHGQWYRGNLVTVKYLREERYYERFGDAKTAQTPL